MIHFFQLLLVSNWISHFYFLWDIDISLYPEVCNRDMMVVCFVQHFETVMWSMNMHLCMQLCSTLLDWQLKKCFATCGIWIFVCFLFHLNIATPTEIAQDNFYHVFPEFSHLSLLSEALTRRQELIKMCHFKLLFIVLLQVSNCKKS